MPLVEVDGCPDWLPAHGPAEALLSAFTLETLQQWIPESAAQDTFRGVDRSIDRLSGFRMPPTEQMHRHRARKLETMERPERFSLRDVYWLSLCESARIIARIDTTSAWENEGGR